MFLRKSITCFLLTLACATVLALGVNSAAAKRVALVIGNSGYQHVAELANPGNDAEAIANALKSLGFEVLAGIDLDRDGLEAAVSDFSRASRGAELTLFYYAGHGLQVNGKNYLIPVDAELSDEADLDFQTVSMDAVLRSMERERRTNLIILDACRNNPLAKNLARSMGTRSASIGRGLAPLETGVGTLISFATQPGNVALDGNGRNSPFTTALLQHINTQNLDVALMMRRVRRDVMDATGGAQVPWSNSSLTDAVYLREVSRDGGSSDSKEPAAPSSNADLQAWNAIRDADSPALFKTFIERFPGSIYADFARARLSELETKVAALDNSSDAVRDPVRHLPLPTVTGGGDCTLSDGVEICASSVLDSQGSNSYRTRNLFDNERATAWVEGERDDGIGEWLVLDFGEPRNVGSIELRNGYTKNDDIYRKNNRVRDIEILTSAGEKRVFTLSDSGAFQRIDLSDFSEMRWLQLRIRSVYAGSKYSDTAISELRIYQ